MFICKHCKYQTEFVIENLIVEGPAWREVEVYGDSAPFHTRLAENSKSYEDFWPDNKMIEDYECQNCQQREGRLEDLIERKT